MKIYFVRHGETDWTKQQRLQGRQDIPLNDNGRIQVQKTAEFIKENLAGCVDVLVSSPLSRARESAEIIGNCIGYPLEKLEIDPMFIERDFGSGEGQVIEDLGHKFPDDSFERMESIPDTCKRAKEAVLGIMERYKGKDVMVVAHGAIIKAALAAFSDGKIVYDDVTIRISPGSIFVLEQNDEYENRSILLLY